MTFEKRSSTAPAGFFEVEAAGLRWLAEAGKAAVVGVHRVETDRLVLERLRQVSPSARAARRFGGSLARLHSSGAPAFGSTPGPGRAWFGPLSSPFEVPVSPTANFGEFWAHRLRFITDLASAGFRRAGVCTEPIERAIGAVAAGAFDGIAGVGRESPSRVHGDLWSGNLMWTPGGAVLIDPAAHGGHRLEDLAMLALFGAPYLEEIFSGYEAQYPMPPRWREDLPAHSLFGLIAHVHLFGGAYAEQAAAAAERAARRFRAGAPPPERR